MYCVHDTSDKCMFGGVTSTSTIECFSLVSLNIRFLLYNKYSIWSGLRMYFGDTMLGFPKFSYSVSTGWTGLFCPCVLFGRNVERLREDTPWTTPCVCHAIFIEGGIALAAATAVFHGIDPRTSFLICEGLLFSWWMCGIYTGLFRQSLQKKYHLKVISIA